MGGRDKSSGVEILNKSRVSRLLAILDNLSAVEKWRSGLKPRERFDWASPEAIHNHCPVFGKKTRTGPSPYAQLQAANIKLQEDLDKALKREDGDTFNPKTSAPSEIAVALVGALAPYRGKAEKVWRELGALVKPKRDQEDSK